MNDLIRVALDIERIEAKRREALEYEIVTLRIAGLVMLLVGFFIGVAVCGGLS